MGKKNSIIVARNIFKSKKPTAAKAMKAVKKLAKKIRHQTEVKYFDQQVFDASNLNYNGTIVRVADMAEGTDEGQHIGNQITPKYVSLRGYANGNSNEQFNMVRLILFIDTEQTGTDPTTADLLAVTGNHNIIVSPENIDHTSRYKIIYDKVMPMSPQTGNFVKSFKIFKKLKKNMFYTGTTTGTLYKNALYAFACSDVNANDPQITLYSRLAYTDS